MQEIENADNRWDMHTERQVAASKGAAMSITILNSGSWIALVTQAGSLAQVGIGSSVAWWGAGAFLGTAIWIFIYFATLLSWMHDQRRSNRWFVFLINGNLLCGISFAIGSLACFGMGVFSLSVSLR